MKKTFKPETYFGFFDICFEIPRDPLFQMLFLNLLFMLMFDWKKAFRGNKVNNNCKIPTDNLKSSSDSLKED